MKTRYWFKHQALRLRLLELAYGNRYWTRHYHKLRRLCETADNKLLRAEAGGKQ
jgi:hypothetical protein